MTEQTTPAQPALAPPLKVDVEQLPETDALAVLYAAYPAAAAAFAEAKERLDAIKDGIKFELTQRAPQGTADFTVAGTVNGQPGTPLRLDWRVSHRFDSRAFIKASPEHAALYERFKKPSGSWTLSVVKNGGE